MCTREFDFDAETHLLIAQREVQGGQSTEERYGDWRRVGDVRLFHRVENDDPGGATALTFTSIKTSATLRASTFAAPKGMAAVWEQTDLTRAQILGTGLALYSGEHQRLPDATRWTEELLPYLDHPRFFMASAQPERGRAFAMNAALSGVDPRSLTAPERTVALFESPAGGPMAGARADMPPRPRHRAGYLVVFADGRARQITAREFETLRFTP